MLVRIFLLLVALTGLLVDGTQAAPAEQKVLTRLPNGLRVVIVRDSRFPLVATRLYVGAGSANEQAAQAGISHLLEHMVFKGTESRPRGEAARQVESLGGYLNAATSFDKTWYITDMPAAHWRIGMEIVKDMAFHPSLDPEELESEKKVVISELERGQDSPMNRLFESLQTSALQNTVYSRPIIGFRESVLSITAEDLRAYVRRWYQPQNMLLLVAGDIEPAAVLAHAQTLFGSLSNTADMPLPQPADMALAPGGSRVEVIRGPWNKAYLGLAFPAPDQRDLRSVDLDVLCYLLGGDDSSLLQRRYQYEKRLADTVDMGNMSLARGGIAYLTIQTDADKLEALWQGLTADFAALRSAEFSPEALHRARLNLEDSMDRSAETLNGLASWLGTVHFALGGEAALQNVRFGQQKAGMPEVRQAAEAWLDPERMRVRLLVPEDAAVPDLEGILQKNWPSSASADPKNANQAQAGKRETVDLGQGRILELLPDPTVPYLALELKMPGGNALLTKQEQGLAALVAGSLTSGSGDLDAQGVKRFFSDRAASLEAEAGLQTFTLSLSGPKRFSADYFSALSDIVQKPRFAPEDVRREAENLKASIGRRADRPTAFLFARLNGFLFPGGHPYGYDRLGSMENHDRFRAEDVRAFWEKQARQPWVLSVAGDFDRDEVLAFARSLPLPRDVAHKTVPPIWTREKKLDLHLPGRSQAHVLQVYRAVPPAHADAPAMLLLQAVLSGQSGPLFARLRDEQGLGYSVNALYRAFPEAGFLALYIGTTPDKVEAAQQGFAGVIADIAAKPLPPALLEAAINRLWGEYYRERQSLASRAEEAAVNAVLGRVQDFDRSLIEQAARVTPVQLQDAVRRYLVADNLYSLTLLP